MKDYFKDRDSLVQFVADQAAFSKLDLPLTMIITPEKSGGYSVLSVTEGSSAVYAEELMSVAKFYSETQVNI